MSHDSGFRQGGRDFTHRKDKRSVSKNRFSRRYDKRMAERFHEQERKAATQQEQEDESDENTED